MKTFKTKKSSLLMAILAFFLLAVFLVFGVRPAAAAGPTTNPQDIKSCMQKLTFVSVAEIDCTFTPIGKSITTIKFIDQNPSDSNASTCFSSCGDVHNYRQQGNFFVDGDTSSGCLTGGHCENSPGITVQSSAITGLSGPLTQDNAGQHLELYFNMKYHDATTGQNQYPCKDFSNTTNCSRYSKNDLPGTDQLGFLMDGSKTQGIANLLQFSGKSVVSLNGVNSGLLSGKNYALDGSYNGGPLVFTQNFNANSCSGEVILADTATSSQGILVTAQRFVLNNSNQDLSSSYPRLLDYLNSKNASGCGVTSSETNFYNTTTTFSILGIPPNLPGGGNTTATSSDSGNTTATSSDKCVNASGGFSLTWLMCPTLLAADAFANTMTGLFENQLSFRVSDLSNNNGVERVKTSWSLVRDIASALLVVVMLVMVISQATGSGPFEAYTVRKLLPKLVVAVILMQLSWTLLGYIVNLVDDVGHGLKDILYLPFRPGNLDDFGALLANAHVGNLAAGEFSWVALLGIGIGVAVGLPTILMFAFIAIMADLTGLAVLVFRKILILMALILAPLALLAWILPGTQSYFKLWYSNFFKALMMFPLVVSIIAAGRIFAYVVGTTGNGTFLNFFLVMVGFFGPLFILPKTFKWGGQAMQAVGNGAFKVSDKLQERPKKYFQARQEDWSAARKAESQRRFGTQTPFNPKRFWQYPLDRFKAGQYDPLLGRAAWMPGMDSNSRMRRRKMTGYKEQGLKTEDEDQAAADREAILDEKRLNELDYNHDYFWHDKLAGAPNRYNNMVHRDLRNDDNPDGRTYRQRDEDEYKAEHGSLEGFKPGYHDYTGRVIPVKPPEDNFAKNAILNRMSELGADTNHLEILRYAQQELASGDAGRISAIQKYMQDHKDHFLKNYPHLLKGRGSTLDSNEIYGIHGAGMGDLTARTTWAINHPRDPDDRRAEQARLRKFVKTSLENMKSTRADSIEQGARRVLKALGTRDGDARVAVLERNPDTGDAGVNANRRRRLYTGTRPDGTPIVDRQTSQAHLPQIELTPEVLAALEPGEFGPEDLRAELDSLLDASGAYIRGRTAPSAPRTRLDPHSDRDFSDSRPPDEPGHSRFSYAPNRETIITRAVSGPTPPSQTNLQQTNETNIQQTIVRPSEASTAGQAGAPAVAASTSEIQGSYEPTVQQSTPTVIERVTNNVVSPAPAPQAVAVPTQTAVSSEPQTVYTRQAGTIVTPSANTVDQRTAEELDYQLRNVYKELKRLGARNQYQQQQFEQLRNQHPDWDNDNNG